MSKVFDRQWEYVSGDDCHYVVMRMKTRPAVTGYLKAEPVLQQLKRTIGLVAGQCEEILGLAEEMEVNRALLHFLADKGKETFSNFLDALIATDQRHLHDIFVSEMRRRLPCYWLDDNITVPEHLRSDAAALMTADEQQLLLCPVCCKVMSMPVLLPCLHSCCRSCLAGGTATMVGNTVTDMDATLEIKDYDSGVSLNATASFWSAGSSVEMIGKETADAQADSASVIWEGMPVMSSEDSVTGCARETSVYNTTAMMACCPVCRESLRTDTASVVPNRYIAKRVALLAERLTGGQCSKCHKGDNDTEGVYRCLQCQCFLCDSCVADHDAFLKGHTIIEADIYFSGSGKQTSMCSAHHHTMDFFCKQCCALRCSEYLKKCIVNSHEITPLEPSAATARSELNGALFELRGHDRDAKSLFDGDSVQRQINELRQTYSSILDKNKKVVLDQVGLCYDASKEVINSYCNSLSDWGSSFASTIGHVIGYCGSLLMSEEDACIVEQHSIMMSALHRLVENADSRLHLWCKGILVIEHSPFIDDDARVMAELVGMARIKEATPIRFTELLANVNPVTGPFEVVVENRHRKLVQCVEDRLAKAGEAEHIGGTQAVVPKCESDRVREDEREEKGNPLESPASGFYGVLQEAKKDIVDQQQPTSFVEKPLNDCSTEMAGIDSYPLMCELENADMKSEVESCLQVEARVCDEPNSCLQEKAAGTSVLELDQQKEVKGEDKMKPCQQEKATVDDDPKWNKQGNANVEEELKSCQQEKAEIEGKLKSCRLEKDEIESELKSFQQVKAKIENELKSCRQEKAKVDDDLKSCQQEKAKIDDDLKSCKQKKAKIKDELKLCQQAKTTMENELKSLQQEKAKIESEIQACRQEKVLVEEKLKSCRCEMASEIQKKLDLCQEEMAGIETKLKSRQPEETDVEDKLKPSQQEQAEIELQLKLHQHSDIQLGTASKHNETAPSEVRWPSWGESRRPEPVPLQKTALPLARKPAATTSPTSLVRGTIYRTLRLDLNIIGVTHELRWDSFDNTEFILMLKPLQNFMTSHKCSDISVTGSGRILLATQRGLQECGPRDNSEKGHTRVECNFKCIAITGGEGLLVAGNKSSRQVEMLSLGASTLSGCSAKGLLLTDIVPWCLAAAEDGSLVAVGSGRRVHLADVRGRRLGNGYEVGYTVGALSVTEEAVLIASSEPWKGRYPVEARNRRDMNIVSWRKSSSNQACGLRSDSHGNGFLLLSKCPIVKVFSVLSGDVLAEVALGSLLHPLAMAVDSKCSWLVILMDDGRTVYRFRAEARIDDKRQSIANA